MTITKLPAEFGVSYFTGSTGFLAGDSFVSPEIEYFTRRQQDGNPPVSHAFTIVGDNTTVEAFGDGVRPGTLSTYLQDLGNRLYVRQPLDWTPELGARIAVAASAQLGQKYNKAEIAAMLLANDEAGHLLDEATKGHFSRWIEGLADDPHKEICSRNAALAMKNCGPEFIGKGCLAGPIFVITPQLLFGDDSLYSQGAVELTL